MPFIEHFSLSSMLSAEIILLILIIITAKYSPATTMEQCHCEWVVGLVWVARPLFASAAKTQILTVMPRRKRVDETRGVLWPLLVVPVVVAVAGDLGAIVQWAGPFCGDVPEDVFPRTTRLKINCLVAKSTKGKVGIKIYSRENIFKERKCKSYAVLLDKNIDEIP